MITENLSGRIRRLNCLPTEEIRVTQCYKNVSSKLNNDL